MIEPGRFETRAIVWIGFAVIGGSGGMVFLLILVLLALVVPTGPFAKIGAQACTATQAEQAKATSAANSIPANYLAIYKRAGLAWNIPWNVLAGIGWVETRHGTLQAAGVHSGENYAGAGGPMQFLQGTFNRAKVDGDHPPDGVMSRYDPDDAIFSAAKLLKLNIFPSADTQKLKSRTLTAAQIRSSIFSYNHSDVYVNDVLTAANRYAKSYTMAQANYEGQDCAQGVAALQAGSFGQRIAASAAFFARRDEGGPNPPEWIHRLIPYSWGGGDLADGPSYGIAQGANIMGFDCSGLARYAVYIASDKKIVMPRTADAMFRSDKGVKVSRDQLAPGDLVFFEKNLGHMGIYYGMYKGKRWVVEAPHTGAYVRFAQLDSMPVYMGALRVTPPPGMGSQSPSPLHAMSSPGAGVGGGVK